MKQHIEKLDVLRGIAILLVFFYHAHLVVFKDFTSISYSGFWLDRSDKSLFKILLNFTPFAFGHSGVQLFLILSGFLIHYAYLIKEQKFDFVNFILRRFFRIYPPYLLTLLFFALVGTSYYIGSKSGLIHLFSHILLVHNLGDSTFFSINPSFWSLALEFQLYLLYPFVLFIRNKFGIQKVILFTLCVSVFCLVSQSDSVAIKESVFCYWVVWNAGAYLAECFFTNKRLFSNHQVWLGVIPIVILILKATILFDYIGVLVFSLFYLVLIDYYLWRKSLIGITENILIYFGLCSYSLYLVHQPILYQLRQFDFLNLSKIHWIFNSFSVLICLGFCFLLSWSLYHLVELPSIKIGQRFYRRIVFSKVK